jgi:hypothetical protein
MWVSMTTKLLTCRAFIQLCDSCNVILVCIFAGGGLCAAVVQEQAAVRGR